MRGEQRQTPKLNRWVSVVPIPGKERVSVLFPPSDDVTCIVIVVPCLNKIIYAKVDHLRAHATQPTQPQIPQLYKQTTTQLVHYTAIHKQGPSRNPIPGGYLISKVDAIELLFVLRIRISLRLTLKDNSGSTHEETKKKSKARFSKYSAWVSTFTTTSSSTTVRRIRGFWHNRASNSAQAPPPPPPSSSTHQGGQSTSTAAPSSSKTATSAEYSAWTTTDTRIKPSITMILDDLYMDDETTADEQAYSSGDEVGRDHIPTVNLRQSWWKPLTEDRPATPEPAWTIPSSDLTMPTNNWASALKSTYAPPPENSLLAQTGDMAIFMDWYCKRQGITHLTLRDLEGPAFEIVKVFHPDVIHLQFQMEECHKLLTDQVDDTILRYNVSKPLPLGGEPGHVTIQPDFFFNKDLEYLRYGRKVGRPALSISKMKAAYYPDVGLEQLVPDQFWIEEECKYDIAAMYGISHWWFQRQRFYIDRFSSEGDRRAVRTHMRILSVVRIEVFSMYGYNYMKKIVLRRADLKEYVIAERDFKYMYPSDFEDLYLLNLQGHLNHLSPEDKKILTTAVNLWTRNLVIRQRVEDFQLGIESYQTQLNLTKPRWEATGFEFKHDFTVIDSLRAVIFRDRYGVQMIMRSVLTDPEDQAKMEMEIPCSSGVNSPHNAHA
ncbi:hypothetical protein Tco_0464849 [Tanacetum coccineum]